MQTPEQTEDQKERVLTLLSDPDLQNYLEILLIDAHNSMRDTLMKKDAYALSELRFTAGRIDVLEALRN